MVDIPLAEAQIVWDSRNPVSLNPPLKVMRIGDPDDSRYFASWGACNADFNQTDDAGREEMLFRKFHELTVGYGLNAQTVHEAFLIIPEYRKAIHPAYVPAEYEDDRR